jgi:hypothetical protein
LPLLASIYYSDEWYAPFGHARMHEAVHAGNHHGLVGALLVVTVLLLSRTLPTLPPRPRRFLGAYLAVLGLYGLANILNDFWLEQVVKRGLTDWQFPSMVAPKASLAWLVLLVVAAFLYWLGFRRTPPARAVGDGAPRSPIVATPAVVVLLAVGLAHGSTQTHTRFAVIDGIVFAAAPHGTSHLFVTSRGRAVQLTDADGSDVAPAWHRGGEISFVSNRSGGWKRYVMHTDGSGVRLLGDAPPDPAQSWLRHQCRLGNHWHICVNGRYLTPHSSDAFAPAWSPDGKRIAFVSDRDGRDELFVMRADGTDVARITHGQVDIDTPTWTRR